MATPAQLGIPSYNLSGKQYTPLGSSYLQNPNENLWFSKPTDLATET